MKYCGTVSMRIASLRYQRHPQNIYASSKNQNVDAIKRMFRQEHGCRKEDSRHHVKALVSQHVLEDALARSTIPSGTPLADTFPYPELEFPPGVYIECLEGHDRLAAADKVLQGSKKRWIVDLYLDSKHPSETEARSNLSEVLVTTCGIYSLTGMTTRRNQTTENITLL